MVIRLREAVSVWVVVSCNFSSGVTLLVECHNISLKPGPCICCLLGDILPYTGFSICYCYMERGCFLRPVSSSFQLQLRFWGSFHLKYIYITGVHYFNGLNPIRLFLKVYSEGQSYKGIITIQLY